MLVDTHCHVYLPHFRKDIDAVLERASTAGVKHIFMPAINLDSLGQMDTIAHPDINLHKMAGLHPTELNEGKTIEEEELFSLCKQDDIVAVGETGLDYHWSEDYKRQQKESLRMHCRVARKTGKPVVLHNRESTGDLFSIIEQEQDGNLRGIWHCFNGSVEEGKRALDLGLHLGVGGVITFKNADVDKAVARLPLAQMMLETDAPYLAPEPRRGERNEPGFVRYTAKKLASAMEKSVEEIKEKTSQTAKYFFEID